MKEFPQTHIPTRLRGRGNGERLNVPRGSSGVLLGGTRRLSFLRAPAPPSSEHAQSAPHRSQRCWSDTAAPDFSDDRRSVRGGAPGAGRALFLGLPHFVGIPPTPPSGVAGCCGTTPDFRRGDKNRSGVPGAAGGRGRPISTLNLKLPVPTGWFQPSLHPFIHSHSTNLSERILCAKRCCTGCDTGSQDRQDYSPRAEIPAMNIQ